MTKSNRPIRAYRIIVRDNYHYQDKEAEYETEGADTAAEAVAICKRLVDESLAEATLPGLAAEGIIERYRMFGEDPYIVPPTRQTTVFSAWAYAEEIASTFVRASDATSK